MADAAQKLMTIDDFFVWQQSQDERYELVEGVPVKLMTGASEIHDVVVINVIRELSNQLRGKRCRTATADLAIKTKIRSLRRADVLVTCDGDAPRGDSYAARNPRMVVEVLSPSNTGAPWQRKLEEYRRLDGLTYILIIDPALEQAIFLHKVGEQWEHEDYDGREGVIELPVIESRLAMAEVYDGINPPAQS
jgi:Uma2 family endonuclease